MDMRVVTPELIKDKRVVLRLDIDVPLKDGKVVEDFRLKAGLETLELCIHNALEVIVVGHVGRPKRQDPTLTVGPIVEWLGGHLDCQWDDGKVKVLENLRFESGEDREDLNFAKQLANYGSFYINEAFAAYRPAASTTVLPTLLPHAAGLNFYKQVEVLQKVLNSPPKPLVIIMGGAKVADKLPVIQKMAKIADAVLVGGKLPQQLKGQQIVGKNVMVGKLSEDGLDIASETIGSWENLIKNAGMIVWNGPMGKIESVNGIMQLESLGSAQGTYQVARLVLESKAEVVLGGGDTVEALNSWGMLDKYISRPKTFVSTGGGAMLQLLSEGTLPTIEALS